MEYDGIIVGGGHNGLICASYLAKAGLKIAVIERNDAMGGGCHTSEFVAPGFKHNSHSSYHFIGEGPVLPDLELHKYGLAYIYPEVQHAQVFRDGKALTIHRSVESTAKSIARFSQNDAKRYKELCGPQWDDLLSYMPLTLHQAVERNFESEHVRMFFNCILHAIAIENVPGVGAFFPRLLSRLTKLGLPVGGAGSVALALERLLDDNGATLIRNAHVGAITSDSKGVTGVRLRNGDTYTARFVASAIDAPQTITLAGEQNFSANVVEGIKGFKWCSHSLVTLHLALNEAPRYEKAEAWDPDVARA